MKTRPTHATAAAARARANSRKKPGPAPVSEEELKAAMSSAAATIRRRAALLQPGDKPTGLLTPGELDALSRLAPTAPDFYTVEKPPHYNQDDGIECIDAMIAAFGEQAVRDHCRITAFKYLWRFNHKGQADADIKKAIWYLRFSVGDDPREYRARA